jgi:phosphoribosylanthranilate isomerase
MTEVKICGIRTQEMLDVAVAAGADFVGFNFFPPSPRFVTPAIASALAPGVPAVGLFVDPTLEAIAEVLQSVKLDALQIYGVTELLPTIRARFGLPVWQAFGLRTAADLPGSGADADRLLLEAKAPVGATRPGGNAATFDWSILHGWQAPKPWMLAGGLNPENVAEAIRQTGAQAVDVSSGVERRKGDKDADLIRAFVHAAKAATA